MVLLSNDKARDPLIMVVNVAVEYLGDQPVNCFVLMMLLKGKCSIAQGYSLCLLAVSLKLQMYRCNL